VPSERGARTLSLFIGGGDDWARYDATQAPGRYRPGSIDELLRRLAALPRASRLYLAAYEAIPEATLRAATTPVCRPRRSGC